MSHVEITPEALPIYGCRDELVAALEHHRVVVVEGTTGSGKTTQIPRILRRAFNPRRIGVTQPRRIAAVSVAWRIADEERSELGHEVGYAIRFDDKTSPATVIKVMTDGILLTEARTDPELSQYDIIVVDEAHERSLNIDVTLGILHDLLTSRRDLRVVISSATLAPEIFQRFFKDVAGHVPLVSVKARVYPVAIQYRPPPTSHVLSLVDAIAEHVLDIHRNHEPGHILVFLTGADMIRRTEEAIEAQNPGRGLLVMPLYAQLTREEQERVFEDVGPRRKVVLATNIAETSITIPDVRYVLDCGLAKVPRFSPRQGITALREEPISRSSCEQRKGRAGRTAPGKVIRLYTKQSFQERPELTDPEIARVDLAEVVLRLIDLGFRNVDHFPFLTPPPVGKVKAALHLLTLLGAIDGQRNLTAIGKKMVPFPLTPYLARMVIEAGERFPKVVDDVLVVGAFLSGRSPFVIKDGMLEESRRAHRAFSHPLGDAVTRVRVYRAWQQARDKERFCEEHFLDAETMSFAAQAHEQLRDIAESQGIAVARGGAPQDIVRAVLSGLPDKILRHTRGRTFETVHGHRLGLHPSSVLAGDDAEFVVAAELVEHTKPYAINVSVVHPQWIREVNPEAAALFGLMRRADGKRRAPPVTEVPMGNLIFSVHDNRGKPSIEVDLSELSVLRSTKVDDLAPKAQKVRARILWTKRHSFAPVTLGKLLRWVNRAPYPAPGSQPPKGVFFEELMEVDRDRHRLERALKLIGQPAARGRSAGWVALVANGAGGYWLDLVSSYPDAVVTTVASLEALADELYDGDELTQKVQAQLRALDPT